MEWKYSTLVTRDGTILSYCGALGHSTRHGISRGLSLGV